MPIGLQTTHYLKHLFAQRAAEPLLNYIVKSNIDFDESIEWPFLIVSTVLGVSQHR